MEEKNTHKKVGKNSNKKKFNWKKFCTSEKTLLVVFCLLALLVVILGVKVFQKEKGKKEEISSNMVVPIIGVGAKVDFRIDAQDLKNAVEYVLKIPNYRGDKTNKTAKRFTMTIVNDAEASIEVYRDKDSSSVPFEESQYVFEEELQTKGREDLYYRIRITNKDKDFEGKTIQVKIES